MTAFAFILGVVPLVLATGSGAHGRVLLGLAVFGGMLTSTLIAIFLIPVSFYVVERLAHRGGRPERPAVSTTAVPKSEPGAGAPMPTLERTMPVHS
jgi:HAE1 family hydrophobic/amphiphilic exporter-1